MEPKEDQNSTEDTAPKWEYREHLKINNQVKMIAQMAKTVAEGELVRLRRKLEKLKYGS